MAEDGYIYVSIMPTTRGVAGALRSALAPEFAGVGQEFARAIAAPLQRGVATRAFAALSTSARRVGLDFIAGFRDARAGLSAFTGLAGIAGTVVRKSFDAVTLRPMWTMLGQVTRRFVETSKVMAPIRDGLRNMQTVGNKALDSLRTGAQKFGQAMQGVYQRLPQGMRTAFSTMHAAGAQAFQGLQNLGARSAQAIQNAYQRAKDAVVRTFGQMRDFGMAAMGALAAGGATFLTSALTAGLNYNSLMQTSRAAMTTLLGTADQADSMLASIAEFAMTSPFPRQAFITGAQQLIAFGTEADRVLPTMSAVQDAVAAAGGNSQSLSDVIYILAQIQASGRITGQDLMQLGTRGINAADLIGSQMGQTGQQIKDSISDGTLDAEQALIALTDGMTERFGGAAANVKSTWVGAMDRVQGATRDFGSILMEPFVSVAGGGLLVEAFNTVATFIRGTLIPVTQEFMDSGLPSMVQGISDAFGGMGNALAIAAPILGGALGLIGPALIGIIGPIATQIPVIGPLLAALTGPVGLVIGALAGLIAISPELQATLGGAFQALMSGGGEMLATLADAFMSSGLLDSIIALAQGLGTLVSGALTALAPVVGAILTAVMGLLVALMPSLTQLLDVFVGLVPILMPVIEILGTLLVQALGLIMTILEPLLPVFVMLVGAVASLLAPLLGLIEPILALIAPIMALLTTVLAPLGDMIATILVPVIGILTAILHGVIEVFALLLPPVIAFATVILNALMPVIQGLMAILDGLINFVVGVFTGNWDLAWQGIQQIFEGFKTAIVGIVEGVNAIIGGIPDFVRGVFEGAGQWLWDTGASLIQGFIDGISSMIGNIGTALGGVMDFVAGFFPNSPARRGPLSGAGWRAILNSGSAIETAFAEGFSGRIDDVIQRKIGSGARIALAAEIGGESGGLGSNYDITLVSRNDDPGEDISRVMHALRVRERGGR